MSLRLLKFGGSSIRDPECIRTVVGIIQKQNEENIGLAIVVSAFGGVTDDLTGLAETAFRGENIESQFQKLVSRHLTCVDGLFPAEEDDLLSQLDTTFQSLKLDLSALTSDDSLTYESLDKILSYGELFSSAIIARYLDQIGIPAEPLDARKVVLTDDHFGNAFVHYQKSYNRIRAYYKGRKKIQVITGFLGATETGETTTLGRSGSDYSAAIFGAALNAESIEIWTDVNGILTADPGIVPDAKTISKLTYEEAMELAHAGAKVIFPPTMIPALYKQIPIFIKNTFQPDFPGSRITNERNLRGEKAIGISSLSGVNLIRFQGAGMVGMRGVIGRIFSSLAQENINIILVSQAFSEHSICFAINPQFVKQSVETLRKEFAAELENHTIDKIKVEHHLSLVAVVGEGMRHTPGIAGNVFGILGREEINVVAIAQGSSERNISFIVEDRDLDKTLKALHRDFIQPEKVKAELFLVGVGTVGKELLSILTDTRPKGIQLEGIASSRKMIVGSAAIDFKEAAYLLTQSKTPFDLDKFLDANPSRSGQKIFVDCTASTELSKEYQKIFNRDFSIVAANKIANTLDWNYYQQIRKLAKSKGVDFRYETNVGAGLPVIKTLKDLLNSGDEIISIEGVFSGTLSYLFNTLTLETPFSELVRQAYNQGYTEPDPRQDLNGMDVARKLLILVRETGTELELRDITVEGLLPAGSEKQKSVEAFLEHLVKFDDEMKRKVTAAQNDGKVLRYIGTFSEGKASAHLKAVGVDHPFYTLSGSENIFAYRTKRYYQHPLVVKGHGAGAAVTAAGLLADIQACIRD